MSYLQYTVFKGFFEKLEASMTGELKRYTVRCHQKGAFFYIVFDQHVNVLFDYAKVPHTTLLNKKF